MFARFSDASWTRFLFAKAARGDVKKVMAVGPDGVTKVRRLLTSIDGGYYSISPAATQVAYVIRFVAVAVLTWTHLFVSELVGRWPWAVFVFGRST